MLIIPIPKQRNTLGKKRADLKVVRKLMKIPSTVFAINKYKKFPNNCKTVVK